MFPGTGFGQSDVFLTFSPDGKQIVLGLSTRGAAKLWSAESGNVIQTFEAGGKNIYQHPVALNSDGTCMASGTDANDIELWDIAAGTLLHTLAGSSSVQCVVFSPDGKTILSGSFKTLKLWDVVTGQELRTFSGDLDNVHCVAFSPDGKTIAAGSTGAKLWDVATGRELPALSREGFFSTAYSIAFSPDGKTILAGCGDDTLKLWDIASLRLIRTFTGHAEQVEAVAFSPDGSRIISGSADGTTRLWDVATGAELAQFISFSGADTQLASATRGLTVETEAAAASIEGEWIAMTPDGYYQASPRGDRYLNVRVGNTVSGIDAYRSIFYNPDVVQARIRGIPDPASKASVTIQDAASFMPPTVTIQSPASNTTTTSASTTLSVNITDRNQSIKNIKIMVNGRLLGKDELSAVGGAQVLQPERASLTVTGNQTSVSFRLPLNLDPGPNRVEVVAFNGYSESRRYTDITWNAPAGLQTALPNLWVLAIGVNSYDNAGPRLGGLGNLNFCVADAKSLVDSLKAQEGSRYGKVQSLLIADGERLTPTAETIRQNLKFLEGADPRRDVVLLFLAGHGISAQESTFFFLPRDAVFTGERTVDTSRALSGEEIMSVLDGAGNRLVFIDACQSGGVDNDRLVRYLMDTNAFVFAASRGNESSYEFPNLGHGAFTYSILSGLKGAQAARTAGGISVLSLSGFVSTDVPRITDDRQHPSAYSLGFYDFPLALVQ
jgi:WD40 repeat protein